MAISARRDRILIIGALAASTVLAALCGLVTALAMGNEGPFTRYALTAPAAAACFAACMLWMTRSVRRRKKILSAPFPAAWARLLHSHVAYYTALSPEERERFRREVQVFLAGHPVNGVGTDVDDRCRVLVAASAVIPVFAIPEWEYSNVGEVLIYPSDFDDDFNFSSTDDDMMGMVTSDSSAVIIAKPALLEAFRGRTRTHVGIHEFVHKLDGGDGGIDGVPALLAGKETLAAWKEISRREIEAIERGVSDIDDYALSSESEFFPVAAEYFFQDPASFARRHAALHGILVKIFRQDPRVLSGPRPPRAAGARRGRRPGKSVKDM